MPFDGKAIGGEVVLLVREFVARHLGSFDVRIKALEERAPVPGKDGRDGVDGKDGQSVTVDDIQPLVARVVADAFPKEVMTHQLTTEMIDEYNRRMMEALEAKLANTPVPKDGKDGQDGKDGKDADQELVKSVIQATFDMERKWFEDRINDIVYGMPKPADGKDGQDGKNVTPEDVQPLIDEAVTKAVSVIPIPKDGTPGEPGRHGIDGKDGSSVSPEEVRAMVDDVVAKAMAAIVVKDGAPGTDGRDGRDAPQIEILPAVDPEKTYPRNTYARHAGGLIRAFRDTDAINLAEIEKSGWDAVVNGIADESEVISEDGRLITKTTLYTNGKKWERSYQTGSIQYQGLYSSEREYQKGDVVTWGGESWYCKDNNVKEEPKYHHGGNSPWAQLAKRGRDGKDAPKK